MKALSLNLLLKTIANVKVFRYAGQGNGQGHKVNKFWYEQKSSYHMKWFKSFDKG